MRHGYDEFDPPLAMSPEQYEEYDKKMKEINEKIFSRSKKNIFNKIVVTSTPTSDECWFSYRFLQKL